MGSKVAGAGAGTGLVVWAQHAGFSPLVTVTMEALAPTIAVFLSMMGPSLTSYVEIRASIWGIKRTLNEAREHAHRCEDSSPERAQADANIRELEGTINELLRAQGKLFRWRS